MNMPYDAYVTAYRRNTVHPRNVGHARSVSDRRGLVTLVRPVVLIVVAALAAVAVSACEPDPHVTPSNGAVPATTADGYVPPALEWTSCELDQFECASLAVPLDWHDPTGSTIDIALMTRRTAEDRRGYLVINPGGPGGSGIDLLKGFHASEAVEAKYDLVGFDPRGIGESSKLKCASWFEETPDQLHEACTELSGPITDHMGTESVARDLDALRVALGQEKLDYLGFSYGTMIGATYAELFPDRVGHFVLDGAMDVSLSFHDLRVQQSASWDETLRSFFETQCLGKPECPLTGTIDDAVAQYIAFRDGLNVTPMPVAFGLLGLTGDDVDTAARKVVQYEEYWPDYLAALNKAMTQQQGDDLFTFANLQIDDILGYLDLVNLLDLNVAYPFYAVSCLDYPDANTTITAKENVENAPIFIGPHAEEYQFCDGWEATREPHKASAKTDPILIVTKTHDPRTPERWAKALADQLDNATLLTYDGWGHCSYTRSSSCIDDAVDAYLLEGTMPDTGTVCPHVSVT